MAMKISSEKEIGEKEKVEKQKTVNFD